MCRIFPVIFLAVFIIIASSLSSIADDSIGVAEFRKLYDSLLSGKTLVNETSVDGLVIKKEKIYGSAIDTGDGEFDVPVTQIVTYTKDGEQQVQAKVKIIDRVNDLGGKAIIQEEITSLSVLEAGDKVPEEAIGTEFGGIYRVGKNDQGGFDVHNFSLTPSVVIEDDKLSLAGSMITYSCSAQDAKTVCDYTVRDFELGEYVPNKGYKIGNPIGGDFTETFTSK
ncbi:MAG: hypothetical protein AAF462_06835 [Thermodesulfobacteriota bacterium]